MSSSVSDVVRYSVAVLMYWIVDVTRSNRCSESVRQRVAEWLPPLPRTVAEQHGPLVTYGPS